MNQIEDSRNSSKKFCKTCKKEKDLEDFYPKFSECKKCAIIRATRYHNSHPKQVKKSRLKYKKENALKIAEYDSIYQKKNSKRICVQVQIRYYRKKLKEEFDVETDEIKRNENIQVMRKYHLELQTLYRKMKNHE